MQATRKQVLLAEAALLVCGIIWGSGFVVMKNSLDLLPINWLLALRFCLAAVLLSAILHKQIRSAGKKTILSGLLCGVVLYVAFFVQTYGLQYTTAGNNAFLTAIYVVLVPFLLWLVTKRRPAGRAFLAGVLCLAGVGIIALNADFSMNIGDLWTLLSGLFYAIHIVCVSHFTQQGAQVMPMTAMQFTGTALCALAAALLFEPFPGRETLLSPDTLGALLYLGLACTLLALVLQNVGIRYAPAAHASLLMSTEAPFGFLFGILLLGEPFTPRFLLGALLIIGSILLSELGHSKKKPAQ